MVQHEYICDVNLNIPNDEDQRNGYFYIPLELDNLLEKFDSVLQCSYPLILQLY